MRDLNTVILTGATGFLGSWVSQELVARDCGVVAVGRRECGVHGIAREVLAADLRDVPVAELVLEHRPDAVIHLAGSGSVPRSFTDPNADLSANTELALHILGSLRDLERPPFVLVASSAAVYGESIAIPMSEDHPREPVSPYGVSKLAAELYTSLTPRLYGVPAAAVRPFSLYGPRQRKLLVYDLMARLADGENPLRIQAAADATRDYVYARDAARAVIHIAQHASGQGEAYNLASGTGIALAGLSRAVVASLGLDVPVEFTGKTTTGNPVRWEGDPARLAALGFTCDTPLEQGLAETAEWFLSERQGGAGCL